MVGIVQVREMAGAERDVVKTLKLCLEASRLLLNLPELSLGLLQELNIGRVFGLCCQGRHLRAELPLGEHVCMVLTLDSIHLPRFHAGGRLQLSILQHLGGYRQLCHVRLLIYCLSSIGVVMNFRLKERARTRAHTRTCIHVACTCNAAFTHPHTHATRVQCCFHRPRIPRRAREASASFPQVSASTTNRAQ